MWMQTPYEASNPKCLRVCHQRKVKISVIIVGILKVRKQSIVFSTWHQKHRVDICNLLLKKRILKIIEAAIEGKQVSSG